MADQWYYAQQGQRQGPVVEDELKRLALLGQLKPTDKVWTKGMVSAIQINSPLFLHQLGHDFKSGRPSAHLSILGALAAAVQSFVGSGIMPTRPSSRRSASQHVSIVMSASTRPSVWQHRLRRED